MIRVRNHLSSVLLGAALTAISTISSVAEDQLGDNAMLKPIAARCADFGQDFVDLGDGVCGRIGSRIRVQLGTQNANATDWTTGTTSSAGLRSESYGMLPGAGDSHHLRVRSGLDTYSPFR